MSILSQLNPTVEKKNKRLGRGYGSGKGAKSGRGTTRHQTAREDIPLFFEGGQARQVKKYPLLRGKGKNNSVVTHAVAVTLGKLEVFANGDEVTAETLSAKKILRTSVAPKPIKIVAGGTLTKKLVVKLPVSKGAKEIIEKAGGTCSLS